MSRLTDFGPDDTGLVYPQYTSPGPVEPNPRPGDNPGPGIMPPVPGSPEPGEPTPSHPLPGQPSPTQPPAPPPGGNPPTMMA